MMTNKERIILREKRERVNRTLCFVLLGILVSGVVGLTVATIIIDEKAYNSCLDNPPDTNWVEEDLERVFMTTDVCCLDWDQEENHAFYDVSANGFYYRCHYVISRSLLSKPHWKYKNYIQINWVGNQYGD